MIAKLAAHDSDHARTHFDDKMLSVEPAEKLQKFWDGIVAEGGQPQEVTDLVKRDVTRWTTIIHDRHIEAE